MTRHTLVYVLPLVLVLAFTAGAQAQTPPPKAPSDAGASKGRADFKSPEEDELRLAFDEAADKAFDAAQAAPPGSLLPAELDRGVDLLGQTLKTVGWLGALCLMFYLVAKLVGPRFGPLKTSPGDRIKVVEFKRIDAKTTLYLLEVGGKPLLVSVSDRAVQALTDTELTQEAVEEAAAAAKAAAPAKGFAALLARGARRG
ncbi:MAG: flagellar biosynthetic protein FliO [Planctomycetota bacterium]